MSQTQTRVQDFVGRYRITDPDENHSNYCVWAGSTLLSVHSSKRGAHEARQRYAQADARRAARGEV